MTEDRTSVTGGFDDLQGTANASAEAVKEARRRRDVFRDALGRTADVMEVIATGSISRGPTRTPSTTSTHYSAGLSPRLPRLRRHRAPKT